MPRLPRPASARARRPVLVADGAAPTTALTTCHWVQTAMGLHRLVLPEIAKMLEHKRQHPDQSICAPAAPGRSGAQPRLARCRRRGRDPAQRPLPEPGRFRAPPERQTPVTSTRPWTLATCPSSSGACATIFNGFHHFDRDGRARGARRRGRETAADRHLRGAAAQHPQCALDDPGCRSACCCARRSSVRFAGGDCCFTYLLPAVPLMCLWDGVVSQLRAYWPDELLELAAGRLSPPAAMSGVPAPWATALYD